MKKIQLLFAIMILFMASTSMAQHKRNIRTMPLDSIELSDPFILADSVTHLYYMTGTSGMLWKSADLNMWTGPYRVAETDPTSWMGQRPQIWAAELHQYKGKYYYFATFTNDAIKIDTVRGNIIPRRASHILVSDKAEGPYRPVSSEDYLPANQPTLDATFWVDTDGHPYMVYCGEWLQNWNGTVEKIRLKDDLSGSIGEGEVLFHAFDSPWSREKDETGKVIPNKVTDGPFLFRTQTGRLGMLWTSWVFGDYTQGVAYSESGTLDGPWIQEPQPITPPNYGHGMLFRTFDGQLMMSVHNHQNINGRYHRVPHLFPVDDSGDRIMIKKDMNHDGFVMLTDVMPDVILEMRYFSTYNFVGRRVPGYEQPVALLTRQAADSLKAVSEELKQQGFRLKVFDAYRPQQAVDYFMQWAKDTTDVAMKPYFYPELEKSEIIPQGYVAEHSGHTHGSTIDLTLFDMSLEKEVDMGCTYDYFGMASHPDVRPGAKVGAYKPIKKQQYANRMILRKAMLSHGFKPLDCEWWHFTLKDEPYPDIYFNFPVKVY